MAGGAKVTTAKTAGPSARRSKAARAEFQNEVDVASLYQLLENQIIPLYYAKPDGKLPLAWLQLMRESIRSVTPVFNTHRMVKEYTERLYHSGGESARRIRARQLQSRDRIEPMESAHPQRLVAGANLRRAGRERKPAQHSGRRSAARFRQSASRRGRSATCARRSLLRRAG